MLWVIVGAVVALVVLAGAPWVPDVHGHLLVWAAPAGAMVLGCIILFSARGLAAANRRAANFAHRMTAILRSRDTDLTETQRLAREAVESLPDPIHFRDARGRRIDVDEAWQRLFGVTRGAFVDETVRAFGADAGGTAASWDTTRVPRQFLADQEYKTVLYSSVGERLESVHHKPGFARDDHSRAGLIGTVVNMVERKELELFDMLGYARSELAGRPMHAADASPGILFPHGVAQGAVITLMTEQRTLRADTRVAWMKRTVSVISNRVARPVYLVTASEDITERKLSDQRQAMEYAITRVLADAEGVAETIPKVLQAICHAMDWQCGLRWQWNKDSGEMRACETWGLDTPEYAELKADSAHRVVEPGVGGRDGLLQRIFNTGKPVWIADAARAPGFARAQLLARAGLNGVFGFPLLLGGEVLGVMEFFHRDAPAPTDALITTARAIGGQVGQYVARKQAEDALKFVATHDALTGLPNRVMFNQRLDHALVQARRRGSRVAVLFIDLDHFKGVNDTLGHAAGDAVLQEVAKRLLDNLRTSDTVARLGGDEFVVLVEDVADPVFVGGLANKLIAALSINHSFAGTTCRITASIGASTCPDDCDDAATLVKNADVAMYRAKEQGRNAFRFYSAQMNAHSMERITLEAGLRRALERGEFVLHYQPKTGIRSGQITGVEALVRWRHPQLGLVPPAHFMQVANESGLIEPIGVWVLQTACAIRRDWAKRGLQHATISVNLSQRQFMRDDLAREIEQVLNDTGCRAELLELEITESIVAHNADRAVNLVRQLKELGVRVVIDDFGTGYSPLSYLRHVPVDGLKIDRSFITDIPADPADSAMTQAAITLAHSLKLNVVAEGVETRQQIDFLRSHGCDEVQGYYVSKPLAAADAVAFIQGNAATMSSTA